jgi:RNA recognition motif-containing protein
MTWLQCLKQMDVMNLVALCAATLALFLAGVLTGLKLGGGRRSNGSGYGGGSRTVRSPDLYIGNLTEDVSGEELEKQFGKFGDVKEVRMVPPRNGETKSFAFITMGSVESAQAALNGMNGRDIMGRKIVVSEARSRRGGNGAPRRGGPPRR